MRYPLVYPYTKMEKLFQSGKELSLRKQMCFAYIKWGYKHDKKAKEEFVELIKRFRKEEGRIGQPRTLLEKRARKLFQKVAKRKKMAPCRAGATEWGYKTKEEGIGVHSPEYKAKLREHNKRIRQLQTERGINSYAKHWIVHSPEGEVFHVYGLRKFLIERNLLSAHMYYTNIFPGTTYKGWWCESVDKEWSDIQDG